MAPSGRGKGPPCVQVPRRDTTRLAPAHSVTARLALPPDTGHAGPLCFTRSTLPRPVMPRPGTAMGEPGRPGRFRLPFRMPGDARAPKGTGWHIRKRRARPGALCPCLCDLARPARPYLRSKGTAPSRCEGIGTVDARASPGLICAIAQVNQDKALLRARTRTGQPGCTFSAVTGIDLPPQGGRRRTGSGPGCVPPAFQTFGTALPGPATPSARATWRFTATKLSGDTEIESIPALTSSPAKAGSLLGA